MPNESRVLSVNVGQVRELRWRDQVFQSAIVKEPVTGHAALDELGFVDDAQANLAVHGGPDKAVYAFPIEHYPFWVRALGTDLGPGSFGENLTVAGLSEADLEIGDRLLIGSVELVVTQPRLPCAKLAARHQRTDMIKRFTAAQRPGTYLAVAVPGSIEAGSDVRRVPGEGSISVLELFRLLTGQTTEPALFDCALASPHLGKGARAGLAKRWAGAGV